jgi:hypothetical protein
MAITIHPDLQALIPALTAEEFQQLEANLLAEGCRDPLVLWQEEQVLLDGHNRYAICTKHELPYAVVELSLPDLDAAKVWMVTNQLGRRNLTPEQTSYLRGKQYEIQKRQGTRTDLTSHQSDEKSTNTSQALAVLHKVSAPTIQRDAQFARAVDAVAAVGGPETRQMILAREAKLGRQDVQRLATLAEEHPQTAKEVLTAVRDASSAKEIRATLAAALGTCEICGKTLSVPSSVERGIGPVCACKPSGAATGEAASPVAANGVSPAPSPLADRPVLSLEAHLDEVAAALVVLASRLEREALPGALDPYTEHSVWLAKACEQVVHTLTEHPVVREAVYPTPAPPLVNAAGARSSGVLQGAVLAMAERQRRFTCGALAAALKEDTKAVWQVLQRLLKQGVVRREGHDYVYLGQRPQAAPDERS